MGTSSSNKILAEVVQSFDSASLDGTPQLAATLTFPSRLLRILNESNVNVLISYDGVHANDTVLAGKEVNLYFGALGQAGNFSAAMAAHTNIYVIGAAGMGNTGSIVFVSYYQPIHP